MNNGSNTKWYVLGAVVLLVFILGGCYNSMNGARINVQNKWSTIQVMYQRRLDLAKQVVPAVNAGTQKELDMVKLLTDQASALASAFKKDSSGALVPPQNDAEAKVYADKMAAFNAASAQFLAFGSANPQWQSVKLFQDYITITEGSENRVAVARKDYNDAVSNYRLATTNFPSNFLAGPLGFNGNEFAFFQADSESSSAPVPIFK